MGGWASFGVDTNYKNTNTDTNAASYGTRTPNLSTGYTGAVDDYKKALNPNGLNASQQGGMDLLNSVSTNGRVAGATTNANNLLTGLAGKYDPFAKQATPLSANVPTVAGQAGFNYMKPYEASYDKGLIDPLLADYDADTAKKYGAFRAGTAGAFGNRRTGLAESSFADASVRGRGTYAANLLSDRFKTAAELGQSDATRFQAADTTNAGNLLSNNQFNAGQETRNRQQQMDALSAQTGITNQQLANVVTQNGIDLEVAQSLFAAGSITQSQLQSLIDFASAGNGSSYTENKTGNTNTDEFGISAKAGIGV